MEDGFDRLTPTNALAPRRTAPREAVEALLLLSGCLFEMREGATATAGARVKRLLEGTPGECLDPDAVMNAMIAGGLRGETNYWRAHCVPTGQRLVTELCDRPVGCPPDMHALPSRRFTVSFRRTFDLTRASARRLRMPAPVEDAHLTDLEIAVDTAEGDVAIGPGRLEAKPDAGVRGRVDLAARFTFNAQPGLPHGRRARGDPQDLTLWLAEREGPIQVTAAVAALAARLACGQREPFDQVLAFRNHVIDTMACGRIALDQVGAAPLDWVIAQRWFDCRLGAALLVALCRARGLPARLVGGYLLWQAPSEHYWMEVWLPDQGWTPFDLLAWDLSAGGREPAWRDIYAGAVDYRMKTQVFPRIFTGAPGVPMAAAWHRLSRMTADGTETRIVSIPDGDLIYADRLSVVRG
ncbi:MAG: transglutaminase-like domain-containing protein [Alphaproteobacteria bacterium]|nr:transglutaminase-like domain-containing protein [Alphaproteobacteria bacterium]MBU1516795.1 transglutaminase-like domain-containing protein [Alphaproteobacteria bacterium]MBU2092489.1 transglutaminase-like domain-containing protein [Alphaproteobacteria bacterium]MBU2152380.1 transglutaminase-like domain-containing protein [Alphaproteobacteria bacterium]MBU2305591.1 transglutaminase-like domain-containing protein [Alphaproteobacteria bacterium]